MKALTVDFSLIAQCMRDLARESNEYFLDKNSGQVISISRDLIRSLTADNLEDRENLPEWDAQMIPIARKIVLEGSPSFVRVPELYGRPGHQFRLAFTETVRTPKLKQRLRLALKGRGSCKRFKEILKESPDEQRRWTLFHENCWKEKISRWLESISILAFDRNSRRVSMTSN